MPYGTVKVDNITFDNGGADQNVTVSGIHRAITSGVTVTGTISGAVLIGTTTVSGATVTGTAVQGTTVQGVSGTFTSLTGTTTTGTTANFVSGVFTTRVSGTTITGDTGQFTSGTFVSLTGTTITGTTVNAVTVSSTTGTFGSITGTTITGTTINGATVNATTGNFTSLTGVTVTGTTAQFVSGVFTTQVSGLTVTGTQSSFTSGNFITLSGATATFTSGVIASGTEAAPSLSILGDPNTGIYSPGADQLAVATNGTGRLFVDASGNVGVGATATVRLDAGGSTATTNGGLTNPVLFAGFSGSSFGGVLLGAGLTGNTPFIAASRSGAGTSLPLTFFTDGTERARITGAGNVGIGTSAPGARFHVDQSATASATTEYFRLSSSAGNDAMSMRIAGYAYIGNARAAIDFIQNASTNFQSKIAFSTSAGADAVERVRIDEQGRVGIGTSSPSASLHVSSTGNTETFIGAASGSSILTMTANVGAGGGSNLGFQGPLIFSSVTGGALAGASEKARIDTSGRLLVGTSSARATYLGAAISAGINVEAAGNLGANNRSISIVNGYSLTADGDAIIYLGRTRSDTIGGTTVVQGDDNIGRIAFVGSDGTNMLAAAQIRAEVDGTPGTNDMPGRLVFSVTADGAASPTEAMRIKSTRIVNIANTPVHADNAAAKTAGLVDGDVYRKSDGTMMIVFT